MQQEKGYTLISNSIFELDLNVQEQSLYIVLISFYNKEKGYAYPSYKQLKSRSKISNDRTLIKYLTSLIDKNIIDKEVKKGIGAKYFLKDTVNLQVLQKDSTYENKIGGTVNLQEDVLHNYSTTNTNTNTNINIICANSTKTEEIKNRKSNSDKDNSKKEKQFEELWSIYPNKKGKAVSRSKVIKLLDKYSYEELKRCIERYRSECIKENKEIKYIKMGSTFFNGAYEDYLDCNYKDIVSSVRKTCDIKQTDF